MLEIDGLREELESPECTGSASSVVVAIRGYHQDRQIGKPLLDLGQQLQTIHARHVDVGENRNKRGLYLLGEPIQRPPDAAKCIT